MITHRKYLAKIAHVTRDSYTTLKVKRSKVKGQGHQAGLLTAAFTHRQLQRSACERIERGKLLLRCRLPARRSARRRQVLRCPHGEERGGAYRVATRTACSFVLLALSPCVLIQKYLHVAGLGLDLGILASFNITYETTTKCDTVIFCINLITSKQTNYRR